MCTGRRSQRQSPQQRDSVATVQRSSQSPQPNTKDAGNTIGRVDNTEKPYRDQLPSAPTRGMQFKQDMMADALELQRPAPTPVATPTPSEPEPKMRVINRTVKAGTTVRGQQTTQSAAPSRRSRRSARMGRRSGTNSLRIARNPNTGSGNLNY